jgi:hypothetical protein
MRSRSSLDFSMRRWLVVQPQSMSTVIVASGRDAGGTHTNHRNAMRHGTTQRQTWTPRASAPASTWASMPTGSFPSLTTHLGTNSCRKPSRLESNSWSIDAGRIAARPRKAGHEAKLDRVVTGAEYDGNRRGCVFGCRLGCIAGGRCNNCDMTADEIGETPAAPLLIATTSPGRPRRAAQLFPRKNSW